MANKGPFRRIPDGALRALATPTNPPQVPTLVPLARPIKYVRPRARRS